MGLYSLMMIIFCTASVGIEAKRTRAWPAKKKIKKRIFYRFFLLHIFERTTATAVTAPAPSRRFSNKKKKKDFTAPLLFYITPRSEATTTTAVTAPAPSQRFSKKKQRIFFLSAVAVFILPKVLQHFKRHIEAGQMGLYSVMMVIFCTTSI